MLPPLDLLITNVDSGQSQLHALCNPLRRGSREFGLMNFIRDKTKTVQTATKRKCKNNKPTGHPARMGTKPVLNDARTTSTWPTTIEITDYY